MQYFCRNLCNAHRTYILPQSVIIVLYKLFLNMDSYTHNSRSTIKFIWKSELFLTFPLLYFYALSFTTTFINILTIANKNVVFYTRILLTRTVCYLACVSHFKLHANRARIKPLKYYLSVILNKTLQYSRLAMFPLCGNIPIFLSLCDRNIARILQYLY